MKKEPTPRQVTSFTVSGITVRTINRDEFNPSTAKLGKHWEQFFNQGLAEKIPGRLENASIYGVYSNYESDVNGHYDVTAAVAIAPETTTSAFSTVTIKEGNYLLFEGTGIMPQVAIDTWGEIWEFFKKNPDIQRQYLTDFEHYTAADKIAIYIGVK